LPEGGRRCGDQASGRRIAVLQHAYRGVLPGKNTHERGQVLPFASLEAGTAFCQSGFPYCDADYDYHARPQVVKDAVAKVSLHGKIGKPMITLHGTLDTLLPISTNSDAYTKLVKDAGRAHLHRYYVVEGGNHVDQMRLFGDRPRLCAILNRGLSLGVLLESSSTNQ
jgi:fermentation-respiration switch protein FrsA (DUF1100 family)